MLPGDQVPTIRMFREAWLEVPMERKGGLLSPTTGVGFQQDPPPCWETLAQNHPAKPLPDPWHLHKVRVLLNVGLTCYQAIDN